MSAQWNNSRGLAERILITGTLRLETPAHFGNSDGEGLFDMPLHVDAYDGRALLTGATLAGALRSYIAKRDADKTQYLFGDVYDDPEQTGTVEKRSEESLVLVDDALSDQRPLTELRDGVAIDSTTRTAEDEKKYDIELLAAGTEFTLSFELLVRKKQTDTELIQLFALALDGLAQGHIRLGKRKRRGFGECRVTSWRVHRYDMQSAKGVCDWLNHSDQSKCLAGPDIFALLGVAPLAHPNLAFCLEATFWLDGSLLIRSAPDSADSADAVHLHAKRITGNKKEADSSPILSGTSAAGALRARALRIVNTVAATAVQGDNTLTTGQGAHPVLRLVHILFGYRPKDKQDKTPMWASRLQVDETHIQKPLSLVHTRVKIDRFTGGSFPGALFSNEPIWGAEETQIVLRLSLDDSIIPPPIRLENGEEQEHFKPDLEAEIGLVLLLLKDLWTGDLPLGGESSVGRGRLQGKSATIEIGNAHWALQALPEGGLQFVEGDSTALERYVDAFLRHVLTRQTEGVQ